MLAFVRVLSYTPPTREMDFFPVVYTWKVEGGAGALRLAFQCPGLLIDHAGGGIEPGSLDWGDGWS